MFPVGPVVRSEQDLQGLLGVPAELILAELKFNPASDLVLFTGSLIEGFGNSDSDIDVYVLSPLSDLPQNRIFYSRVAERWIDITYYYVGHVKAALRSISDIPDGYSNWIGMKPTSFETLDLCHDLMIGFRVTQPWASTWDELDIPKSRLQRSWAYSNIMGARARWLDAIGAYRDGQYGQASYAADICASYCIDAYTSLLGETDLNVKWRWAKLARLATENRDVLRLQERYPYPLERNPSRAQTESRLLFLSELLFDVMCLFFDGTSRTPNRPSHPCERYEVFNGRWVHVKQDGRSYPCEIEFSPRQ